MGGAVQDESCGNHPKRAPRRRPSRPHHSGFVGWRQQSPPFNGEEPVRVVSLLAVLPRLLALCLSLLGAQALAEYTQAPDGSVLLDIDTSDRYLVAGGAKFYIPPAQWSVYSNANLVPLPWATIHAITKLPRDGTLIRQNGYAAVYVVMGQRFWYVQSPAELEYWGHWGTINNIPNTPWEDRFTNYNYSVLVRERSTSQVYLWNAGARYPITNPSDLVFFGGEARVKTVPLGALTLFPNVPWCGVRLRERTSLITYMLGRNYSTTPPSLAKSVTTGFENSVVPDGSLASFPLGAQGSLFCLQ